MGYNIYIGNAVPVHHLDDFPHLAAGWEVEVIQELPEAPDIHNDTVTGKSNTRSPSYGVWSEFCKATGLYELFFEVNDGLMANHPGCMGFTKETADVVTAVLARYQAQATLPPGFEEEDDYRGPPNYDYHLGRLIWLEFWMQWAVKNCKTPAIQNT